MRNQNVVIGKKRITIPEYCQIVQSMPEDPPGSVPFAVETKNASVFAIAFPIPPDQAMPFDKGTVIDGIRRSLDDEQGIVEVDVTKDYVYSIVKTLKRHEGVLYTLTLHRRTGSGVVCVQGFFQEIGTVTGIRDMTVYEICRKKGLVGDPKNEFEGWTCDPYYSDFRKGVLMNLSKQEQYDSMFPDHPLTLCRDLLRTIAG